MNSTRPQLPIDSHLDAVLDALKDHNNLVLVASPGAGKTTRIPPALLNSVLGAPGIILLEPRRLAARASAARIAQEQGWSLGQDVGYQVRFENRTSDKTRLCVMTEGLLNRRLNRDPQLEGIGCVILDEFHERSWQSDLGLGLLRELQMLARPDLKIVVMSATLNAERVAAFLGHAPIIDVKADAHLLTVVHDRDPQLLVSGPELTERVARAILDVVSGRREGAGDILVFLPGAREIRNVAARIESEVRTRDLATHMLHGSLRLEDQDRALRPSPRRKIILATNIAETSLTIDGVHTVIDSGLARVSRLDSSGFSRLELSRISRFSSVQRAGRAARQGPGYCYRLWTKLDEASMNESEAPEILRTDLCEAVLLLASQGVSDLGGFSWFERPSQEALEGATDLLVRLGALERNGELIALTGIGRRLLDWPLHPRLARIMETALAQPPLVPIAAKLAALVSERDILSDAGALKSASDLESDVLLRLEVLEGRLSVRGGGTLDPAAVAHVRRAAEQIESIARSRRGNTVAPALISSDPELELLLIGFPDRVARRRRPREPEARMVGGRGVKLAKTSCVERSELFVAIDAVALASGAGARGDMSVTLASRIEPEWLRHHFPERVQEHRKPALDLSSQRVLLHIFEAYDDLPLEEPRRTEAKPDEIAALLPDLIAADWNRIVTKNESAARWLEKYEFLKAAIPEKPWPVIQFRDANDPATRALIEEICIGEASRATIAAKDLAWHFENALGSELAALVREEAPEFIEVPTGNRMRVSYPPHQAPFIEVRIQEVFGLRQSPTVASGRVRVVLHLLGPNFRPVQVTSDLLSFWANGYIDVRKELRARYPKHSWPENPLEAPPTARGGRRR